MKHALLLRHVSLNRHWQEGAERISHLADANFKGNKLGGKRVKAVNPSIGLRKGCERGLKSLDAPES